MAGRQWGLERGFDDWVKGRLDQEFQTFSCVVHTDNENTGRLEGI